MSQASRDSGKKVESKWQGQETPQTSELKRAFVTGGTGGIGREIVRQLLQMGFHVDFSYRKTSVGIDKVLSDNKEFLGQLNAVELDLETVIEEGIPAEARASLENASVLVNNAALSAEKKFERLEVQDWQKMLAVNLIGPSKLMQAAIPGMVSRNWGRLVNIVSIGGQVGGVNQAHYAASKAGLISLTKSLSNLYASQGVTSNAVSPGLIATEMSRAELGREDGQSKLAKVPVGRPGSVKEVAGVVGFLVTDAASYVTGQVINVNGGSYLG